MAQSKSIHEPEAELLSAEDAVRDRQALAAERLTRSARLVPMRVPLSALFEALEQLDMEELRQVSQYVQNRIVALAGR